LRSIIKGSMENTVRPPQMIRQSRKLQISFGKKNSKLKFA